MAEKIWFKKKINPYGVNQFINKSIETAIDVNKTAFDEKNTFSDACWQIVFAIENAERVIKGCGIIDDDATAYNTKLEEFKNKINSENFDNSNKSTDNSIRAVKIAQYKFQLLIEAVRAFEPTEYEIEI